ncbi:MAG TPA: carboxypeptidase regulatory-like domain-containing protein [Blastocatellia bacterium]|nr:carboxypeptidase regulatory-like domain-containing protein [Blastocatellia bacterium]
MRRKFTQAITSFLMLLSLLFLAQAQTATTTSISGLVSDPQGAVIPGASVTLRDKATNQQRVATTNEEGRFVFANLDPGLYELTVTATGFKKASITEIKADVTKPVVQDIKLEAGVVTEEVTVSAGTEAQLQKQDSSVGNTLDNRRVTLLPNISREATRLLALQPGVTTTGEVSGARADQSTFSLDGVDVSDNVIGQTFRTVIPTPAEQVEEFRVTVANPNATFGRSSGAQVVFVTKRGSNSFHGSLYEYHQNDALNANSWTNNRLGLPKPKLIDNRFGGTIGGPIFKDKTFFFFNYEGRRNASAATVSRIVPTSTLKAGLLRFRDASGAIQTINPKTFDPRGIGPSPTVLQLLALYPDPNDFTLGDTLNTAGFTSNFPTRIRGDLGTVRIDHQIANDWSFDGKFSAYRELNIGTGQVDIVNRRGTAESPSRPRTLSAGLTGVLSAHLTNEFRFGWTHDRLAFDRISPFGQVTGLNIAADLAGALLDEPIDVDTQRARKQARTINTYQFIDNATWTKNTHTLQMGFNVRHITSFDFRDDKVIGSITTPVAQLGSSAFNTIPSSQRPSFIQPADVSRYNQFYASLLGMVENITFLATRNGQLEPNPPGTGLFTDSKLNAYEIYAADTWRIRPQLTISYGLMYSWQVPPTEKEGKQTVVIRQDTGELLDPNQYLKEKFAAAAEGRIFNPVLAYVPIRETDRKGTFDIDRKNFSPRIAVAWTPSFENRFLRTVLGGKETVIRGGYSLLFDRINTVQTITIPTLGVGFAQTLQLPAAKNAAGQPFRAGVDGPLPLPTAPAVKVPIVPGLGAVAGANAPSEVLSFVVDPFITVPRNHTVDFSIQRELPGRMILEVGYIGRFGRNLYQSVNLNQVPYNFKDTKSGQTFAQAFDALADQLRAGVPAAAVTPQPWFENLLPKLAPVNGSRTIALAARQAANIINGNLTSLFLNLDAFAAAPFNNFGQATELFFRTSGGRSNYNAFFATLRKRFSNNLTFDMNYTLSRSLDQVGAVQNSAGLMPNSFDFDAEYSPSSFDATHIFNGNWVYELPVGKGQRFINGSNAFLSRLISGWYTAGIFRASSGFPITIVQGSQVWGGSLLLGNNSGAIGLKGADFDTSLHKRVVGSGGIGTAGNPATNGSGINIFANPEAVFKSVRRVHLSEDGRSGRNALRGLGFWQLDLTAGKATSITETVKFRLSVDLINVFNHVNFNDPGTSLQNPTTFGVISSQRISDLQNIFPRRIQLSGRIEF